MPTDLEKKKSELIDSINQSQKNLELINEDIKKAEQVSAFKRLEIESIQRDIDFLNKNLEQRKQDTKDFEENYKLRLSQLEEIKQKIKDKELEMIQFEKDSTSLIKVKVDGLNTEVKKLEENKANLIRENEAMGNKIIQASQDISQFKDLVNDLEKKKNDLLDLIKSETKKAEEVVAETDKKKSQLLSYTKQVEEIIGNIEKIKLEYSSLEMEREQIKKEIAELVEKKEEAKKEFDVLSKKAAILIDRGAYQDEQEKRLKEDYEKIGREYQPFKQ